MSRWLSWRVPTSYSIETTNAGFWQIVLQSAVDVPRLRRRGDRVISKIKRRHFIALLGGAAGAWPLAVGAQQSSVPTVGVLYGGTSDDFAYLLPSFRRGLTRGRLH
jgi:hypothetical protein